LNVFDLDAERLAQCFSHIDVEPAELRCRLVEMTERQIVAGHADTQRAAFLDFIQTGAPLRLRRGRHQKQCSHKAG